MRGKKVGEMRITNEERMRRLLIHFYNNLLGSITEGSQLTDNLDVLDATRDCIYGLSENTNEWTISKTGLVRFK